MQGIEGVPVPYSIATDNVMTLLLMACFVATIVAVVRMRRKMVVNITMVRCQWFLSLMMCLMYAILYFIYIEHYEDLSLLIHPDLQILIYFLIVLLFFLAKRIVTRAVGLVFFNREAVRRFTLETLFLMAMEGLCLIPAVYLTVYVDIPAEYTLAYALGVVILFRILTIFRQKVVFFHQKNSFLGFIVYLCTLEITPFFVLWSLLGIISGFLTTNILV